MSDISELERRITSAMDRIAQGADALMQGAGASVDAEEVAALKQQLEDEKLVTAQLEERLKAVHEKHDAQMAELRAELASARSSLSDLDAEMQRVRKASDQLRDVTAKLRDANASGVGDAHLINKAMLAELEALRATRALDAAEASAIYDAITPLLADGKPEEEGANA